MDEPLAENYVHVAVAVAQNLYADASGHLVITSFDFKIFKDLA